MMYRVEFEVEDGNCEIYKKLDPNDCEKFCKMCPLRHAPYCMDLNMHNAKIHKVELI